MCEAALEAPVHHLKTFTLLQGTRHATFDARLQTKPSERREKPAFRRRKEEKGQTQPQLYGTQYFSVRIALTGHLGSYVYFFYQHRRKRYTSCDR
jgi:hypothetical protein